MRIQYISGKWPDNEQTHGGLCFEALEQEIKNHLLARYPKSYTGKPLK